MWKPIIQTFIVELHHDLFTRTFFINFDNVYNYYSYYHS